MPTDNASHSCVLRDIVVYFWVATNFAKVVTDRLRNYINSKLLLS